MQQQTDISKTPVQTAGPNPLAEASLFRQVLDRQLYTHTLYLLLAFPLGVGYLLLVLCGVIAAALNIVIIGLPLTGLVLYLFWKTAAFERNWAMSWLHITIAPMAPLEKTIIPPGTGWVKRLQIHLLQPVTWKSMLYLFAKFPFGVLSFCLIMILPALMLTLSLASMILCFLAAPFVYMAFALAGRNIGEREIRRYLSASITGFGLILSLLYLVNALAQLWGQFARLTLGMNDQQLRLAEATERAEREHQRAEISDQKRRDLIVNVSHELRTPIASIRGHAESLLIACDEDEQATPSPEMLRKYLTIVHRESMRLGTLVDDLLSVARAERSEMRVTLSPVEAGDVVEEVYQTLMPLAKRERQIALVREIAPSLPTIQADRQRLMQVLLNLVRNAITYTPDGGIVAISLRREDNEHLALVVADTGIGIPPEDRERIFERFYRTDASRARTTGGFGLGLAIVRDFVIAMGGAITVESKVGEGSSFCVYLNVAE
jgi:two-component system phosphate regulon sensor histidine kinase PhoR